MNNDTSEGVQAILGCLLAIFLYAVMIFPFWWGCSYSVDYWTSRFIGRPTHGPIIAKVVCTPTGLGLFPGAFVTAIADKVEHSRPQIEGT